MPPRSYHVRCTLIHPLTPHPPTHPPTLSLTHTAPPPPPVICQDDQFSCFNREQCIGISQVCDDTLHCQDGSDEHPQVCQSNNSTESLSCDDHNGGCQHLCHTTGSGYVFCTCRHGYQLGTDSRSCVGKCLEAAFTEHACNSCPIIHRLFIDMHVVIQQ